MKKTGYLIIMALIFSFCKRKNIEATPAGTLAKFPVHCYNGLADPEEIGIDCGGPCETCVTAVPTCTQAANRLTLGATTYTATNITCGNLFDNNSFDFRGSYVGGTFIIRVSGTLPDVSKSYPVNSKISPDANEAYSQISSGSLGNMSASTGTVFINNSAGKYTVTLCSASYYSFTNFQTYSGILKVTCQ
ncbi:MAG TPA: hypothetical protein PL029_06635 [Bacteroidia bacterium]|nr:hypothetical protein [Bacteroidia bacterium]